MKFILKLLKEILNRVSNLYSNESVDELLSSKVSKEDSDRAIEGLANSRKHNDDIVQGIIDSNKSYDEALTNVIKWQSYAASMQSMVDEDTAIQIAEEFEKAAEEYLKDPTVTVSWSLSHDLDESGNYVTNNPYFFESTDRPIIDFTVVGCNGSNPRNSPSFNKFVDVPVFLPNATSCAAIIRYPSTFNSPLFLLSAKGCSYLAYTNTYFNSFICAPMASDCTYLLCGAKSFNQKLRLPNATGCSYMLNDATSFNQPLSLPKATTGTNLLKNATSFNSSIDLPTMVSCNGLLYKAKSFNQSFTLPNAKDCHTLCQEASSLDQPVYLPACRGAINAFLSSGMSAENISKTLDSLPTWTDGASHAITFMGCPGQVSTQYLESFTVTDENGVDYTLDNCPRFDTDDENQTLRKSFVLAIVKKGWTVELNESALAWYEYMLDKATSTGEQSNVDLVNQALNEYEEDSTAALPSRLVEDWKNLYAKFEAWIMQLGEPTPLNAAFWVDYFRALDRWGKNPDETVDWTQTNRPPEEVVSLTNPNIVFLGKGTIKGAYNDGVIVNDWSGKDAVIYTPNLTVGNFAFYGSFAQRLFAFIGNVSSAFAPFSGFKNVYDVFCFAPFLSGTSNYSLVSVPQARNVYASFELVGSMTQLLGGDGRGTPATLYAELLDLHAPSAKTVSRLADYAANRLKRFVLRGGLPSATSIANMLRTYSDTYKMTAVTNIEFVDSEAEFPNVDNGTDAFYKCTKFNQFIAFPSLHTGNGMFLEAGMSAENISAVLDSLPSDPVEAGGTGVITFTGCPGALELTQDSPSVANAIAKGWTVEL